MNLVKRFFSKQRILSLILLFLVCLLIWFIGPFFAFAGNSPFVSLSNRILTLVIVTLIWGILQLRTEIKLLSNKSASSSQSNHNSAELVEVNLSSDSAALADIFKTAKQYLKKKVKKFSFSKKYLYHTPWILLIGPKGSGKTSLLKNENLFPSSLQHASLNDNNICNWWFNNDVTILDINSMNESDQSVKHAIWLQFINLLKNLRRNKPFDGVIINISIRDLMLADSEKRQELLSIVKQQLHLLNKKSNYAYPIYLIFNQFDQVAGFTEFFGDMSVEERCQIWGIHCKKNKTQSLTELFDTEYSRLITKLNDRLIWRLHQERNQENKTLIKDFPTQMESLTTLLKNFIKDLCGDFYFSDKAQLQGIYFTSAIQQGIPIDRLLQPLKNAFSLTPISLKIQHKKVKPYFAREIFSEIIIPQGKQQFTPNSLLRKIPWPKIFTYSIAGLFTLIFLGYCMTGYKMRTRQIDIAQNLLTQYQYLSNDNDQNFHHLLLSLNTLAHLSDVFHNQKTNKIQQQFAENDFYNLSKKADLAYHQQLVSKLRMKLIALAYRNLYNVSPKNPAEVYQRLKIYLMLGSTDHINKALVVNWAEKSIPKLSKKDNKNLEFHLNQLLSNPVTLAKLNMQLISLARRVLNNLTYPEKTFVILTASNKTYSYDLLPKDQTLFDTPYQTIPYIYTTKGYDDFNNKSLINAAKASAKGNWVLGNNNLIDLSPQQVQSIAKQTKFYYQKSYANLWQQILDHTKLKPINNISQALDQITQMTSKDSLLKTFLLKIDDNTKPIRDGEIDPSIIKSSTPNINLQLQVFHSMLYTPNSDIAKFFQSMDDLKQYLAGFNSIAQSDEDIFSKTRDHIVSGNDPLLAFSKQAVNFPQPMNSWANQLSTEIWQQMLSQSQTFINQQWQQQIVSFYQQRLQGKYPISNNAFGQISLQDFTDFFAPNGLIEQFREKYLDPFIKKDHQQWTLKKFNGYSFPIHHQTLLQLQLASYITKMFFPHENQKLAIHFTLQPLALEPIVKLFKLEINNKQSIFDQDQAPHLSSFIWPGNDESNAVTLNFTTINGDVDRKTYAGPWALFKALQVSQLSPTSDPKKFALTFDLNGNSAKYLLNADFTLNPFIANVVNEFNLPPTI